MKKKVKIEGFDQFACIGGECPITCCQEWKISVDEETEKRWKAWEDKNPNARAFTNHITTKANQRIIHLNDNKQCPFLNQQKLCTLVIEHGDGMLSKTCASFPRLFNEFDDRMEYSLMSGCPVVIDQMKAAVQISFKEENDLQLGANSDLAKSYNNDRKTDAAKNYTQHLLSDLRTKIIVWVQDDRYSIEMSLMMIFYSLLELQSQGNITAHNLERYFHKEIFEAIAESSSEMKLSRVDQFYERNELFLDFIENYRKEKLYTRYLAMIAKKAEELSNHVKAGELKKQSDAFQNHIKAYDPLFRNYLVAELFNNSLHQESDLKSFIMMFQWLVLEYTSMRHAMYLCWLVSEEKQLPYEVVRDYMVVFSRMMGYEEKDIHEYLEVSYPNVIWDWGYLALLVGNNHK